MYVVYGVIQIVSAHSLLSTEDRWQHWILWDTRPNTTRQYERGQSFAQNDEEDYRKVLSRTTTPDLMLLAILGGPSEAESCPAWPAWSCTFGCLKAVLRICQFADGDEAKRTGHDCFRTQCKQFFSNGIWKLVHLWQSALMQCRDSL